MKTQRIDKRLPAICWEFPACCSNSPPLFYAKSVRKWVEVAVSLHCDADDERHCRETWAEAKQTDYTNPKTRKIMKRTFILSLITMAMFMAGTNASAQSQGRGRDKVRVEHRADRNPKHHARPDRDRHHDRIAHKHHSKPVKGHVLPRGGRLERCAPPARVARGCYVPGWEGRVRLHHDGRWGYYVNGAWRYYNCYYNPYLFFCEPMPPHVHHSPHVHGGHASAGEVAAGVVAGTILGCIIGTAMN